MSGPTPKIKLVFFGGPMDGEERLADGPPKMSQVGCVSFVYCRLHGSDQGATYLSVMDVFDRDEDRWEIHLKFLWYEPVRWDRVCERNVVRSGEA